MYNFFYKYIRKILGKDKYTKLGKRNIQKNVYTYKLLITNIIKKFYLFIKVIFILLKAL